MRWYLLIITLFLYNINSFSQISLDKFDVNKNRIITSKEIFINTSSFLNVSYRLINIVDVNNNNTYYIQLCIIGNNKSKVYSKGNKLLLKMKDGTIIELLNQKNVGLGNYEGLAARINYLLNREDIERLLNGKVIKMRIEDDSNYSDIKIKRNTFSKKFKKTYDAIQGINEYDNKPQTSKLYNGF